jgi:hypothetical protein
LKTLWLREDKFCSDQEAVLSAWRWGTFAQSHNLGLNIILINIDCLYVHPVSKAKAKIYFAVVEVTTFQSAGGQNLSVCDQHMSWCGSLALFGG